MNDVNGKIFGMIRVSFYMNLIFFIIGMFGIISKTSFMIVVFSNLTILGSIFILKKNEHLINGVIATNKIAKEVNKLIK